jgi:hypothetical protein
MKARAGKNGMERNWRAGQGSAVLLFSLLNFRWFFRRRAHTAFGLLFDRTVKAAVYRSGDHSMFLKVHLPQANAQSSLHSKRLN